MQKSEKSQKLQGSALWATHIFGWVVIIFIGIGRDDVNPPFLIGGTLLMLITISLLIAREFRQRKAEESKR